MTPLIEERLMHLAMIVAREFGVTVMELRGPRKSQRVTDARLAGYAIARQKTDATCAEVGAFFGGRDPSTVTCGVPRAWDLYESDADFRRKFSAARHWFGELELTTDGR